MGCGRGGFEVIQDDRTSQQHSDADLSDGGLGDDLRDFLAELGDDNKQPAAKPARQRNLLPTFRVIPGDQASGGPGPDRSFVDPGFPGTKAFARHAPLASALAPHRSDPGAAGSDREPARGGDDHAPASAPRTDDLAGRGAAVQPARADSPTANRPAQPQAEGGAGGRLRGRRTGGSQAVGAGGPQAVGTRAKAGKPAAAGPVALPKAIEKLLPKEAVEPKAAAPRVIVPTESERSNATRLFRQIGKTFNENRKKSKTAAYAAYRHDLMENLDTLIMGGAIDLKEVTTVITNLEQYTKETEAESTETPATILGRWLRMSVEEAAGLEVAAVEEPVEELDEELGEEIDEL
jgi:hypothetical protein